MFRLALALGRTVGELEDSLGSKELNEWQAYYHIEPFGQWRDNYHAAMLATAIYNTSGRIKKPAKINDFMIEPPQITEQRKQKEVMALMQSLSRNNNGKK